MMAVLRALVSLSVGVKAEPHAELVEINHYLDRATGKENFTQIIAWDWDAEYGRWNAQAWCIVTDFRKSGKLICWQDYHEEPHTIRCTLFRETWTYFDPERENQKLFPTSQRRKVW